MYLYYHNCEQNLITIRLLSWSTFVSESLLIIICHQWTSTGFFPVWRNYSSLPSKLENFYSTMYYQYIIILLGFFFTIWFSSYKYLHHIHLNLQRDSYISQTSTPSIYKYKDNSSRIFHHPFSYLNQSQLSLL